VNGDRYIYIAAINIYIYNGGKKVVYIGLDKNELWINKVTMVDFLSHGHQHPSR
jgi:hypothetical protein